jgi:hypothetical protein
MGLVVRVDQVGADSFQGMDRLLDTEGVIFSADTSLHGVAQSINAIV